MIQPIKQRLRFTAERDDERSQVTFIETEEVALAELFTAARNVRDKLPAENLHPGPLDKV